MSGSHHHTEAVLSILRGLIELLEDRDPAPPGGAPGGQPGAGTLRRLIVGALAAEGRPLKASVLARRCQRSNSGHFRDTLAALCEEGAVVRCPGATYGLPPEGQAGPS